MDGTTNPETLRRITLRVEHDCPLARLSRAVPDVDLRTWSGHQVEVVEVECRPSRWQELTDIAADTLRGVRILPSKSGGLLIWRPTVAPNESLTRRMEQHGLLWLQPMHVQAGWEHYDAFAFEPEGEAAALQELSRDHATQVARRQDVAPDEMAAALFQSMLPALRAPTDKQAEALVAAWAEGYYRSPRAATTADVAGRLGIGRSAFEERLRGGENKVMAAVVPVLGAHRGQQPPL